MKKNNINKGVFDSNEELYFTYFLNDLKDKGFIDDFYKNEESYPLTKGLSVNYIKPMKKVNDKVLKQTILSSSIYTPDFIIKWNDKALGIFVTDISKPIKDKIITEFICQENMISVVEVKGAWDNNNMTRLAINNIKVVWDKHSIFVNLIKIPSIFNKLFTPERYFMTDKTFKPRKLNYKNVKTLKEYLNEK